MNTRPVRVAVVGVVVSLLVGGCGADETPPDAAVGAPSPRSAASEPGRAKQRGDGRGDERGDERGDAAPQSSPSDPSTDIGGADDAGGSGGPDSAPALEMPTAPEPTVSSLSQLLPPSDPAPLVTTPLPRAGSMQGGLLRQFPTALRPPRAARVQSSSLSPAGDRLQVGLVASTTLTPAQVLLAYRTRLVRRGMTETATPPSVAGSRAAAFRRGASVVTVTVTPRGTGASYAVHASLRAERG